MLFSQEGISFRQIRETDFSGQTGAVLARGSKICGAVLARGREVADRFTSQTRE